MVTTSIISNYLETELINHIIRNNPYSPPASTYIALYTTDPGDADGGTEVARNTILEGGSGTGYERIQCPTATISNNTATFGEDGIAFSTATFPWGTVTHMGIKDADTGGNLLFYGALDEAQTIERENTLHIYPEISLRGNENGGWGAEITEAILKFILNKESFSTPGLSLYMALGRSIVPDNFNNCLSWTEINSIGYSRKLANTWTSPSDGLCYNIDEIVFTEAASVNWGTVSHAAIFNSSSAGNMLIYGKLTPAILLLMGDGLRFKAGALSVAIA
jgi:hypothetical protein